MGDSRAKPGQPDEHDGPPSRVVSQLPKVTVPPRPEPKLTPQVNARIRPEAFRDPNDHATRRNMQAMSEASTRIVQGDALANIVRPPPPDDLFEEEPHAEQHTRAWSDVEGRIRAYNSVIPDDPPSQSSPGSSRGSKSGASGSSGVAARDGRVAAMRELYARGDTEGALALAADISDSLPPLALDHPEATSAVVEVAQDRSFDMSDPFGGLIPLEEDQAAMPTVLPPPVSSSFREEPEDETSIGSSERRLRPLPTLEPAAGPSCAAPQLSLTERHSIPVLQKSLVEVSRLPIDHRAGFLLTLVDGMQTLEEILDVCAMPADEALELIEKLREMGVLAFE